MSTDNAPIKLGDKVKDELTGFTGVATCRSEWLHGCSRIMIEPDKLGDKGSPIEGEPFDEQRVTLVSRSAIGYRHVRDQPIFRLGDKLRDKINGFSGIAVARHTYLGGFDAYTIEPETLDENGQPIKAQSYESTRLDHVAAKAVPMSPNADPARPGGPQRGEDATLRRS